MSQIIERPQLPPKEGYVEVVDESGNHIYEKTPELFRLEYERTKREALEQENASLKEQIRLQDAKISAQIDRNDFVEECLAEMVTVVYV